MLSYLYGWTQPEISMHVHQCARFFNNPRLVHGRTIRRIVKYLASTYTYVYLPDLNWRLSTRGVINNTDKGKFIECYVYADCDGGQAQADADNSENFMSRTVYVITYAVFPVLWCSKLQAEIYLSTTEAEYIALGQAMPDVITFMDLMKEVSFIFDIHLPKPEVFCKLFEDNQSCIFVAESNRFSPRKRHISIKYHHFWSFVQK